MAKTFISVKKWDDYQHYKDRHSPWIKFYGSMLTSEWWIMGSDASKLLAICIMALAQRCDNKIPNDVEYIKRFSHIHQEVDLAPLVEAQFIEIVDENGCYQDASNALSECKQLAPREEKRREDKKPSVSNEKIVFDGSSFQHIESFIPVWESAYPALDVRGELAKAAAWLVANPKNKKSQYGRFLNGWLSRAQDRAPRVGSSKQPSLAGVL